MKFSVNVGSMALEAQYILLYYAREFSPIIWQEVSIIYITEFHFHFILDMECWTTMCFLFSTLLASITDINSAFISVLDQLIWRPFQPNRVYNSIICRTSVSASFAVWFKKVPPGVNNGSNNSKLSVEFVLRQ